MIGEKKIDISENLEAKGQYICGQCGTPLFEAAKKFDAGCGFPSFWMHKDEQVKLNPLDTYGRQRIQLLCNTCHQHLGHLFTHKQTPTQLRYCINGDTIRFQEL